jgi:hypothetical protein
LTASSLKIKVRKRDRLFYDQYRYCLHITLQDLYCLRDITNPNIGFKDFAEGIVKRLNRNAELTRHWGRAWAQSYSKEQLDTIIADLNNLAIELWPHRTRIKMTFSGNSGYVYSDDLSLLRIVEKKNCSRAWSLTEAAVDRPKNTIQLTKSDYKIRSYFKERRLNLNQKKQLHDFLTNQTDVKITGSMAYWFSQHDRFWTRSYFFIDHTSELTTTMLEMLQPDLIRRSFPIVLKDK